MSRETYGTPDPAAIEKLPSGQYRAVVRHDGSRRSSEAVRTHAEVRMLEAKLKLSMGGAPRAREAYSVGEVVAGYITDAATRLSPGTLHFYRRGRDDLAPAFAARGIAPVTPLVLDSAYNEMRAEGASEHKVQKLHRLLSAAFNRAVRYKWITANPCLQATKPKPLSPEIEEHRTSAHNDSEPQVMTGRRTERGHCAGSMR